MMKVRQINKIHEFKFSYKDLIQRSSVNSGPGLVLFLGGLLAKTAWAMHQEASVASSSAVNAHKLPSTHGVAEPDQSIEEKGQTAAQSHADASTSALAVPQATAEHAALASQANHSEDSADPGRDPQGLQVAALDAVPKEVTASQPELAAVKLTVDLSDLNLGTVHQLPTITVPLPEYLAPAPAITALEGPESYLKWLGLFVGGGTAGAWTDFAAGVVSSSTTIGGYAIDGALYNSVVYRYDSAKSSSNYTDIFGDGSVYDYVWGGSAGLRYTTSAGAYYALPTSGGSGGAIKVMASTSSYDMGWDSSMTYGFNTPLIMSSPYDTGTGQVVNPFTTLIQGLLGDTTAPTNAEITAAASKVSAAFGLSTYYSSLGITSASELLYFNPLDYTSSSVSTTKNAAIAMQAQAIQIVATISGGTQAVLAQNTSMDEVSVTKAILSSLVSYVDSNYAAGVDLSSATVIDSLMSSVTADDSSGSSATVYLSDQALSTIAAVNDYVYLNSTDTSLTEAYAVQLQLMKNTDYSDAAFEALSNVVIDASNGDTILALTFTSTAMGAKVNNIMSSLVADPMIKIDLSSISYTTGDSLVVSDLTNTYEHTFSTAELKAGITAGYITFNLSDLESSGVSLSLSEAETFVVKAYLNKSGSTVDGSGYLAFMQNTTGNNIAYISGTPTGTATEDSSTTASGTLTVTDTDSGEDVFATPSSLVGSYGTFTFTTAGAWTYTLDSTNATIQALGAGVTTTDTLTVYSADGTDSQKITVTITGVNDASTISGTSTASLTETNAVQSATGTLSVSDVDSNNTTTFVAQTNAAGSNGYGKFTVTTAGVWTYTMNSAQNAFVSGTTYTDSVTVAASDGTTQTVTVTMTGTDDASTISGTSTASLTETNAVQTATGTLTVTDVDSTTTFVEQTDTAGTNGYGTFSVTTGGVWTYTMNSAQNAFVSGATYTDSVTVATSDGTTQTVTVTMTGTDDASTITGTSTASLTETDAVQTATGTLTVTDVDSTTTFVAQTNAAGSNGYGKFTVTTGGVWTYAMNTAHNEFVSGTTYTDSVTVATSDGTTQTVTVTMTGTDDASTISGTSTASLTETNAVQTATGTLTVTDVDSTTTFVAQTDTAGDNGYGTFSVTTGGVWTYTMDSAQNAFEYNTTYTDSVTVATSDGTTQTVTVTMTGTNDAATIVGTTSMTLTETDAAQSTSGTLVAADDDSATTFVAQTNVAGDNGYGIFSVTTGGVWTYTMNSAQDAFVSGTTYTDSISVATADGTTQTVTVSIVGTNDSATISGDTSGSITDYNSTSQSTTDKLTLTSTDLDGTTNLFIAQTAAGTYGSFVLTNDGSWTYSMTSAQNFDAGSNHTDSFTAYAADGTAQTVTLTIKTPGVASATLTETDAAQSVTGTLSSATYVSQTDAAGSNGYGKFTLATDGSWTYTMDSAQNAFASGTYYTDTLTATDSDGNTTTITVTITGTNDSATISGTSTATLTESDVAQTATGTLTVTDVDSSATFVAQTNVAGTNGYGTFSLTTGGVWTYTMNSAQNAFVSGTNYTDSFTAASADGTTKTVTVTMTGTNDAATFGGTTSASLTETNSAQTASGTLTVTDVDSTATFVAQTLVAGSNGYGKFSITTAGVWTYTMNSAQNAFVVGTTYTDTFTVKSYDGSSQVVTVSIAGSNDAAVISGTSTYSLTETNAVLTTTGTLTSTDVDGTANLFTAETVTGSYGSLIMLTTGAWTYTSNTAKDSFVKSTVYTDTFTVHAGDGTASTITVNITGTNDAAVISGTTTYSLTETDAVLTTSGTLTSTDVDGTANLFTAETVSGSYGSLVMSSSGAWTYTAASIYNSMVAGAVVSDTFTVHAADGTSSSITVSITGSNDTPVMSSSTASITLDQGATSQTIATVSATDADLVGSLTYSISRQNGDASADYFTVDSSTGVVTFTSAGAISTAVDATDTNGDGVMDTPYVIHVIATDDKGAYATETITVNVDMAVSSSGLTATLPGATSNWSFAPQTTTSGDSTVSDGFRMTSTTNSSVYINLPSTVTSLSFTDGSSLTLSNDASTGTVTDTSTSNHNFTITTGVTENTLIQVKAASTQTITGVTDTTVDPDLGTSTNYRDDTLQITDAAFSAATFSMSGSSLLITMSGSGAVKTLSEIETVKFTDHTVRIVGASGYASFTEAINQGNTSHAQENDYLYVTTTPTDLTHLTLVSGTTDFYTYHG